MCLLWLCVLLTIRVLSHYLLVLLDTYFMETVSSAVSKSTGFNQHCILQTTILALKWPMCADVPLNHIKIKIKSNPLRGKFRH